MSWMLPLPVAIPLLTGAAIAAVGDVVPDWLEQVAAILAAASACAFSLLVMAQAQHGDVLHWFGGWTPRQGVAVGVSFAADPLGAAMAALAGGLVTAALVYSWSYMAEAEHYFHILMLVFYAGMCGFALTGDLFNMFVWFEVMGVAAYALAGLKVEELGPIQGAFNFAITNTIGAYMIVTGIALLYARTGALNLAQIGRSLAHQKTGGFAIVALTLIVAGFLVKAAVVPFHLWLADAHAVAPAPVCVLFSGAMVELGLLGVARVYWTAFDGSFAPHHGDVRAALVWMGVVTALLGAVMAFLQRHLKRLLAYSTISHAGIILVGIGLLDAKSLGGSALMVLSHGLLKAGLFLAAGIVLQRLGFVDELRLRGRGRGMYVLGGLYALGAIGLIGLPYVGGFSGHSLLDDASRAQGRGWVAPLVVVAAAVASGAILRSAARIFLGWGDEQDPLLSPEPEEEPPGPKDMAYGPLIVPTALLVALGLAVSVVPGLEQRAEHAAGRFLDRATYAQHVLAAKPQQPLPHAPYEVRAASSESWAWGLAAGAIALATAAFGLWRRRVAAAVPRVARMLGPPTARLQALHSGVVGDYAMWITVGAAVLGGAWALTLR